MSFTINHFHMIKPKFNSFIYFLIICCSSFLSIAVCKKKKHSNKKQPEKRGFIWLTLPGHSPLLRKVREGAQGRNRQVGAVAK